jgi:hypothetical protein
MSLQYHVSANGTPQYLESYDVALEAIFDFDPANNNVKVTNTTGAILSPGFAELYRATQRIQHIESLVWTWVNPVTANATSQKIIIPTGNPITMKLSADSDASVKITCPVIHKDTQQSADDRVLGNADGFSIFLGSSASAESAGLQAAIVADLLAKLGGTGYDQATDSLKNLSDKADLIPKNPLLTTDPRLDNLDATVSSRLPTSSYTAPTTPPTVVQIRQEMDTNSTKLANLDAQVSSRLAGSEYTAPDNTSISAIKAKTNNLPAVPASKTDVQVTVD